MRYYTIDRLLDGMDDYKSRDDNEKRYLRELGLMWRGKPTHLGNIVHAAYESDVIDDACIRMLLCVSSRNEKMTRRWVPYPVEMGWDWPYMSQEERVLFTLAWIECRYGINPTHNAGYTVRASDLPFYTSQSHLIHHMQTQHDQLSPLVSALDYIGRISEEEAEVWSLYLINTTVKNGEAEDESVWIADFCQEKRLRRYLGTMVKEDDLYLYEITEWNYNKTRYFDSHSAEEWLG